MLTDISVQFQYYQRNPLRFALKKTMTSPTTLESRKEITWAVGLMALNTLVFPIPVPSGVRHSPKQQLLLENYVKECSISTRIDFKLSSLQPQRPVHPLTGMLVVTPAWQISLPTTTLCWLKQVKKKTQRYKEFGSNGENSRAVITTIYGPSTCSFTYSDTRWIRHRLRTFLATTLQELSTEIFHARLTHTLPFY